jgi:imidazolonepropionase-like amidohydrolase
MRDFLLLADRAYLAGEAEGLRDAWFLVRGGRVEAAGEGRKQAPPPVPVGLPAVRASIALEPLCDAHVHLFLSGSFDTAARRSLSGLPREGALARILELLRTYRRMGIAAVRDGGDPYGLALEAARQAAARPDLYARVFPSGEPLFPVGGKGTFLGRPVKTQDEIPVRVEELAAAGVSQVKVLVTGLNSLDDPGGVEGAAFGPEDLDEIARAARRAGLPLMVHANGSLDGVPAMGPDTVEHGFWLDVESDLPRLAREGIAWTPTVRAWSCLADHPDLTARQKGVVAATHRRHLEEIRRGAAAGVTVLPGSDAGTPGVEHVTGFYREVAALGEAGLSPEKMFTASAAFARKLLGEAAPGLRAGGPAGFSLFEGSSLDGPPKSVFLGQAWSVNTA